MRDSRLLSTQPIRIIEEHPIRIIFLSQLLKAFPLAFGIRFLNHVWIRDRVRFADVIPSDKRFKKLQALPVPLRVGFVVLRFRPLRPWSAIIMGAHGECRHREVELECWGR